jgi:hypothetical protein
MPNQKYDWIQLKQDFFNSEFFEVEPFLKQKFGRGTGDDGNIAKHAKGWTNDKKEWQQKRIDEIQKTADKELKEKLKIQLSDLLTIKKLTFELDMSFLEIFLRMASGKGDPVEAHERNFVMNYPNTPEQVIKRVNLELGLPTNREILETNIEVGKDWDVEMDKEFEEFCEWRKKKIRGLI